MSARDIDDAVDAARAVLATPPEPRGGEGLKPCPFCASDNLQADFSHFGGSVECLDCGATLPLPTKSPDTQAAAWNRRPSAHPARMPTREELCDLTSRLSSVSMAFMNDCATAQEVSAARRAIHDALFHPGETKGDGRG